MPIFVLINFIAVCDSRWKRRPNVSLGIPCVFKLPCMSYCDWLILSLFWVENLKELKKIMTDIQTFRQYSLKVLNIQYQYWLKKVLNIQYQYQLKKILNININTSPKMYWILILNTFNINTFSNTYLNLSHHYHLVEKLLNMVNYLFSVISL